MLDGKRQTNSWMNEQMDGGWTDRWWGKYMDRQMDGWTNRQTGEQTDG